MSPRHGAERHAAAYRRLLLVYPASFRREVGEEAVATFRHLCRAASAEAGPWGIARLWLATAPLLLWGGVAERLAEARRRPPSRPGASVLAAAGVRPRPPARLVDESRAPWGWALLAAASVFLLYAATLAPTTAFWDTSEYIATGHVLGVPHPPGNPLFVVLARTWEVLLAPLGLPVAVRTNAFSAFMSAAAHGLWFLVVHHVLRSFGPRRVFRLGGAFAAVAVSATAFTVWNQSNVNEKVYTVSLLTVALLSWLAFRWHERIGGRGNDNLLVLMAFLLALSVGNHLMAFLAAPALVVFVALVRPRTLLDWKLYPALLLAGMAGLTIHLFLPIRAALGPVINQGAPLCDSVGDALGSILTWGRGGCEALGDALRRRQYTVEGEPGPGFFGPRQAPLSAQLTNYLQYFDWQWARSVQGTRSLLAELRVPFTMLFAGLGVWGAVEHFRRQRPTFWYVLVLFATLSLALAYYLNFEYGFSIADPVGDFDLHEVRERDYFFVVSFSVWGLWAGIGIAALWRWLAEDVTRSLAAASPVLLLAAVPLALNWSWADRSRDWAARDWAYNLLQSVEPYGVLFTVGDNDTFPLWYLQEVEGIRKDVTVIVTTYLNIPWYAKQLRDLTRPCPGGVSAGDAPTVITCQRDYVSDGRATYTARPDTVPEGVVALALARPPKRPELPILQLDDATIERVGRSFVPLEEPLPVRLGRVRPVIPGGQVLYPWQQFALAIVDTAFTDGRPVYWASSGNVAGSLGLDPYLVRQGVAFRLDEGSLPDRPPRGVIEVPDDAALRRATGRWLDVPRTETLMDRVFLHRGGLPHWDHWPDAATSGIPAYYAWGYYALAVANGLAGDDGAAARYRALADDWAALTQ